jgi:uncharacterized membrane protein
MLNNILSDIQKILRGKNGSIFFVALILLAVIVFFKVLPSLIWFLVVGTILFFIFRFFEKKSE